ncbi:hypothetical protein DFH07DRAFT_862240 [Mycena maculata]|uniref:Uncharacterized protein n=1 Tax=Mycena maculata TaxID=230809 RepID=A0AAD7HAK1_9AGAR|nr:hypothetical protein DFH07DRAFT_862240 [Mycena maculata]
MYLGVWAAGSLHSTATLSIQSAPVVCMGLGSCTVPIFPCLTTATRLVPSKYIALTVPFEFMKKTQEVPMNMMCDCDTKIAVALLFLFHPYPFVYFPPFANYSRLGRERLFGRIFLGLFLL